MSEHDTANTAASSKRGSGRFKVLFFAVLMGGLAVYGGRYYINSLPYEWTDDAFIEGDIIAISPQVSGQVLEVHVETNQAVQAGDLLFVIDSEYYEERVAHRNASVRLAEARRLTAERNVELVRITSKARLQQVEAELVETRAVLDEVRAQVEAADAEATRAKREFERHQEEDESIFSQREIDLAASATQIARAELVKSRKQVMAAEAAVEAVLGRLSDAQSGPQKVMVSETEVEQRAAEVDVEASALKQAELDLKHTKVYAPISGRVTRKTVDEGEQLQIGQVVMAIVPKEVWIEANFRETQLTDMRPGQPVEIRVDTYKDRIFMGTVHSIQAGTGARFSLLPPQNATGNYVKVVQRLPVKIVFDEPPEDELLLVPGMSVVPRVRVR